MRYFYSKKVDVENGAAVIDGDEYHHAVKVNRLREGDECIIINGEGLCAHVVLGPVEKRQVSCRVLKSTLHEHPEGLMITVCCGISRKGVFATVVEKAVELGVDALVPLVSERSMVKVTDNEKFVAKHIAVVREALKQCHRFFEPAMYSPVNVEDYCDASPRTPNIRKLLLEPTMGMTPRALIDSLSLGHADEMIFAVGPEGGFSQEEKHCFARAGFENVYFPHTVMRTGTAVAAMLSLLRYGV